jgi:chorismate mutase
MSMEQLADCRRRIDAVDLRILTLLNERTRIVEEIGRIKQKLALPIYEPRREDEVYRNVFSNNTGPLKASRLPGGTGASGLLVMFTQFGLGTAISFCRFQPAVSSGDRKGSAQADAMTWRTGPRAAMFVILVRAAPCRLA